MSNSDRILMLVVLSVFMAPSAFGQWWQTDLLVADDGDESHRFGYSVSVSGDTAVIGAERDEDNGGYSGSAYIFRRDDNGTPDDASDDYWTQQAKLLPNDAAAGDYFGASVSVSGNAAIVGAAGNDDNGNGSGSAYIFRRDDSSTPNDPTDDLWVQQAKLLPDDGAAAESFGCSVSVFDDTALIGARMDDDDG